MISVVVPAHNESSVIARTLVAMTNGAGVGELDVIVVCNGCTDNTAAIARRFGSPVRVVETEIANKPHALNLGDDAASTYPRIYVDADVVITFQAIQALARRLDQDDLLAVAPMPHFDLTGCSRLVRAFYDIRSRLPSAREAIGGSGVYGLSRIGRSRFDKFANVVADDTYVRIHFRPGERETLVSAASTVFAPRTLNNLVSIRTRAHYGNFELSRLFPDLWKNRGESNDGTLVKLLRYPSLWPKLMVYYYVNMRAFGQARFQRYSNSFVWHRDRTSRSEG
jgi:glycosyltransferase involved in cell wall biosynthesis